MPQDAKVMEEQAWLAYQRNDWPLAHACWLALRTEFPDRVIAYAADGVVLRHMGQFDAAESLYQELFVRWPDIHELDVLADYAELAQVRGNLDEGSRRWAQLRVQFPDAPKCYLRDAVNLSSAGRHAAAESLLREALARWPQDITVLSEFAQLALKRGLLPEALTRWQAVLSAGPQRIEGYLGVGHALYDLRRWAQAQAMLRPALTLFPDSVEIARLHARLAFAADDFPEAVTRWSAFRRQFPDHPAGFAGGIQASLAAGDYRDAAALSEQARALFPHDLEVAVAWAATPEKIDDVSGAEARWALAYDQFPHAPEVRSRYVRALLQNEKGELAETLLSSWLETGRGDFEVLRLHAECATARGDWRPAESRWHTLIERFPASPAGAIGLGEMLRRAGRLDESVRVLQAALAHHADDPYLEESLAWTLTLQRVWSEALPRWEQLVRQYPHRPSVLSGSRLAVSQAQTDLAVAANDGMPPPFDIPANLLAPSEGSAEHAALKALFMRFDSLGDTCEFGLVQRHFGAEPLSLLRWASISPPLLIAALDNQLQGVGEPEHTVVEALRGEFVSWDRRYSMHSHTFTPDTAEPLADFTRRHLRRLQYLRRKLLEDLAGGEKVFVYHSAQGLTAHAVLAIHAALRRHQGRAALLCVTLKDASHEPGLLQTVADGLWMGYIDRFSTVDFNVAVWATLCRRAAQLQDARGLPRHG